MMDNEDFNRGMGGNGGFSALTFVLGAVVGASVALLMAPAPGHQSRQVVGKKLREWGSTAKDGMQKVKETVNRSADDIRNRADDIRGRVEGGLEGAREGAGIGGGNPMGGPRH